VSTANAIFAIYGADPDASLLGSESGKSRTADRDEAGEATLGSRLMAGLFDVALYVLAVALLAAVLGQFDAYHPRWMFKSPALTVTEPWQGGWTTKGVGALVATQALLIALFVGQTFLATTRGRSIGKYIFGLRIERLDGGVMDFAHGALRRSWPFIAVPLVVALGLARPISLRGFLLNVPTVMSVALIAVTMVAAMIPLFAGQSRALHDRLSGTRVVTTSRWQMPDIQLRTEDGIDPVVGRQVLAVAVLMLAWSLIYWWVEGHYTIFG
jgi:uncharacterized RDD family membrane protein YckC